MCGVSITNDSLLLALLDDIIHNKYNLKTKNSHQYYVYINIFSKYYLLNNK